MILENGVVRTLDSSLPRAAALALAGDRIAGGVGTHETALASPDRVDLGGRCVLPGFTDSHVHFPSWALAQRQVRLEGSESLDDALARVASAVGEVPRGQWLRGLGWRNSEWSPSLEPTKEALDAVAGDVPVALMAKDYHSLWVNSAALALADADLQVPGGVVERDEHGEPTGVLREECAWHFRDTYVRPTEDEMVDASREAIPLALSRGVVAVHDKDGWLGALRVFQRLKDEGSLNLRIWQSLPWDHLDRLQEIGISSSASATTSCASATSRPSWTGRSARRTALMLDGTGVEIVGYEEFVDIVRRSARAGFPVAVHAIGDRANRRALDAFEETRDEWHRAGPPPADRARAAARPRGHRPLRRDRRRGLRPVQPCPVRPRPRRRASGPGRPDGAYAFRSLIDSGALVANGSDAPVEELDPLFGISAGVTRTLDERDAWHPEQALTIEQALHATCVAPAWLTGDERRRGKLLPGYLADLVVLDRDPLECPPEELGALDVVATMVGGRWVHNPPPWG